MADMTDGERIAEERIAEAARTGQDWLDLGGLALTKLPDALSKLTKLKRLSLGDFCQVTAEGVNDRVRPTERSSFSDISALSGLIALQELYLENTRCDDLSPIAKLQHLQRLSCPGTKVSDLSHITGLHQLQQLDCSSTQVSDLSPINGLLRLQYLNCSNRQVGDLSPIAGLKQLQHLDCSHTQVSDLSPIAGLQQLHWLHCHATKVSNLSHLTALQQLQYLGCHYAEISNLSPIAGLKQLKTLGCGATEVSDLAPIAELQQLQRLSCFATEISDLSPIAGLRQLQYLDFSHTQVSDLTPIAGLEQLQFLSVSECKLATVPISLWRRPLLTKLDAKSTSIPGIPDEVLGDNCLQRLRAHLAELEAGAEHISEAKLLILGNGRAGKTQIARRLAGQPFQPQWDSTHGIRITQVTLPAQDSVPETRLKLWDFGGQEIYHGTHALFARTRAIFLLVWSRETELPEAEPDQHGMEFRNHPLRYWHAYARDAGHKGSPLIIAQTRLDQDGVLPPPLDQDQMASSTCVQVSTADPPRINTLRGALQDAVVALHQSRGAVEIGKPRILLQRRIEKLRQPDGSLPEEWRLMEKSTFAAWYQEEGGIASAEYALAYLNDNGTVFYRAGLFQDRIVLDQNWAMAAIYALFDRKESYGRLQRRGGLFERADLAQVWRDYSEAEQRLFLSMMTSCDICFVYRKDENGGEDGDNTLYLAPEFLPEKAVIQVQIDATWGEGPATHRQVFTYAFLHEGLIRNVISQLGALSQTRADYFRGGVCLYDAQTRARALVMQHLPAGEWQGSVSIETKDGDAAKLLARLAELVSEENRKLNLSATTDRVMLAREAPAPAPQAPIIQATRPPGERPKYAISYAWNETDSTGPDLEAPVNLLCDAAGARHIEILRDKQSMVFGASIRSFMLDIARSQRIFIFLSDKYLKSTYCMRELYDTWIYCRQDAEELKQRVRVFKLPDANISDVYARAAYREYWDQEHQRRSALHQQIELRDNDLDELDFIERLKHRDLMKVLGVFQDTLRYNRIEEFIAAAFD
jgi:internalin A